MPRAVEVIARIGGDRGTRKRFVGREAWALRELARARSRGITTVEHIGPRLSHYVMKLRRSGIGIETMKEQHAGAYRGWHARYKLRTPVKIEKEVRA
jgi:hypothetical protein